MIGLIAALAAIKPRNCTSVYSPEGAAGVAGVVVSDVVLELVVAPLGEAGVAGVVVVVVLRVVVLL